MHGIKKRIVYVIRSDQDPARHYVGITNDLPARLEWHNRGPRGHTRADRPWSVVVSLEFRTEKQAVRFEKYLKSGSGRAFATRHFGPGWRNYINLCGGDRFTATRGALTCPRDPRRRWCESARLAPVLRVASAATAPVAIDRVGSSPCITPSRVVVVPHAAPPHAVSGDGRPAAIHRRVVAALLGCCWGQAKLQ